MSVDPTRGKDSRTQRLEMVQRYSKVEGTALKMLKPIDVATIDPVVIQAAGKTVPLWHYWRTALSSSRQTSIKITQGRHNLYFVMDKTSGGLLGIFALGDAPEGYAYLDEQFGWDVREDISKSNRRYNAAKWTRCHTILYMHRCLPVYEFGELIGGKLLALIATSRELTRSLELRYSFLYSLFLVRTLEGKSSQYNRLNSRGLIDMGSDALGRGMLFMELRKNAKSYLRGELEAPGKSINNTFKEQVEYWRERWFLPRAERMGITTIVPDINRYRVSSLCNIDVDTEEFENERENCES